ncbi:Gluconeogenesis factor [compost metagenome]
MRPLEAINLVRSLLKIDAALIPMSEQPVDLMAHDHEGHQVYGEVNIDQLRIMPQELMLSPPVHATREAVEAIAQADLILIGPGSFLTSLMPLLLLEDLTQALRRSSANMVYIGNLGRELSVAAAALTLQDKLALMEEKIGRKMIDAVIVGPAVDTSAMQDRIVVQQPLEASDIPYRHDRQLLRQALDTALVQLASRG